MAKPSKLRKWLDVIFSGQWRRPYDERSVGDICHAEMMHKLMTQPMKIIQSPRPIERYTWGEFTISISHSEHRGYGFRIVKDCGDDHFKIWAASDGYVSAGECDSKAQRMIAQSREGHK